MDILAKAEDVSKLNRVFERLHYAAPENKPTEDEPLKKAESRVPQENRSAERGTGWPQEMMESEPISIIDRIRQHKRQSRQSPPRPGKDKER